jgi:SAM-dependent methyltransferase
MSRQEFQAINGRQSWANWRTIPRCLSGNVPDRPLRIVDLGCGTGSSTEVLAWYAPPGSHLSGHERSDALVNLARLGQYEHRTSGHPGRVDFVCQDLTEPLREKDGGKVAGQSVDVVNSSGVLGHHFNIKTIDPVVRELCRVLRPGGIAMLDIGPTLPERDLTTSLTTMDFRKLGHWRSWRFDPTGQVVYRRGA